MKYISFILILVIFTLTPFELFAFTSSSIGTDSSNSSGSGVSSGGGTSTSGGNSSSGGLNYTGAGSNSSSTYSGSDSAAQNSSNSNMSNLDGVNDQANASYAPAVCEVYIKDYIRVGANTNAPQDVKNLQAFLNTTQGEHLVVDGAYKDVDVAAVKRFQTRYIETLKFWGLTEATGQVLQTTINKINTLQCERNQKLTCPYFGGYQKLGAANPEVVKIKKFLNNTQGESLDTSSNKFDNALFEAVKRFQSKYLGTALRPWGITTATGFWYQSTRKTAHDVIGCFEAVRLDNGVVLR